MFHIHGGEFMRGASNLFPAHVMAAFYEVVVVTINYRLGALGNLKFNFFHYLFNDVFSYV
jgi:carboxylesterase type B